MAKEHAPTKEVATSNNVSNDSAKLMQQYWSLAAQMHQAEAKLRELRSGGKLVTAEERAAVERAFLAAADAWAKRKRMFRSIWCAAALLDHIPPS